ncbi:DUF1427 family protein [Streptomyces sp. SID5914]|nr:DUF1427 family protein [Streptomyces sp. SID5914]MZG13737.1 DUF1427 family protein [Streptomyces sp. SID5914]
MTRALRGYVASALAGLLAGTLYHLLGATSPAPPWIALAGLLGILLGEHATRSLIGCLRGPRRRQSPADQAPNAPSRPSS